MLQHNSQPAETSALIQLCFQWLAKIIAKCLNHSCLGEPTQPLEKMQDLLARYSSLCGHTACVNLVLTFTDCIVCIVILVGIIYFFLYTLFNCMLVLFSYLCVQALHIACFGLFFGRPDTTVMVDWV